MVHPPSDKPLMNVPPQKQPCATASITTVMPAQAGIHDILYLYILGEQNSPLDRIPAHVTVWVIV